MWLAEQINGLVSIWYGRPSWKSSRPLDFLISSKFVILHWGWTYTEEHSETCQTSKKHLRYLTGFWRGLWYTVKYIYCHISRTENEKTIKLLLQLAFIVRNEMVLILNILKSVVTSSRLVFVFCLWFLLLTSWSWYWNRIDEEEFWIQFITFRRYTWYYNYSERN